MALRRAQKPTALGDDVTGAINLLVRLLPLVQMILMYHLYFQVTCLLNSSSAPLAPACSVCTSGLKCLAHLHDSKIGEECLEM